jgi:hypothetical protein
MGSFLSSVSGQFAKSILLGTFFPVVLFAMALSGKVLPMAGVKPQALLADVLPWETDSALLALTAFVLILTILLYSLNTPLIRLYEGYPWRFSWLGQWRTSRHVRRFQLARGVTAYTRLLDRRAREASVAGTVSSDLATLRTTAVNVESTFPDLKESVLPTQLGNVIRAFEVYPKLRYGIQAIPTWPRLVQTLAAEKAVPIDDAKSAFDFMLNCSVLSAVTGALLTAVGLSNDHPFRVASGVEWLPWTASFSILSYLFYLGAINRAAAWGTQVKAAFDLNRLPLLEAMGYKTEISGPEEERTLWEELSYELVFPNTPNLPKIPYRSGQSTLTVRPVATILAVSRSIKWETDDKFGITVTVENSDPRWLAADAAEWQEKIPKGFRVTRDSVQLDAGPVETASLNPLVVGLGSFDPGVKKVLAYKIEKG